MDESHKEALRKNRRSLVNDLVNVESVVDRLLENDILTEGMKQDILEGENTKLGKARKLMDIIPKRGPRAFHIFCQVLVDTSNSFLAGMLDPNFASASPSPSSWKPAPKPSSGPTYHPSSYPVASTQSSKPSYQPSGYQPSSGSPASYQPSSVPQSSYQPSPASEEEYKPTIDQKGSMPMSPVKAGFEEGEKHIFSRQPSIPCQPAGEEEDDIKIPGNWTETLTSGAVSLPPVRVVEMDKQIFSKQNAQMAYLMGRKPRGRVLIFNNKFTDNNKFKDKTLPPREHSDDDNNRLIKLFKKMDFRVLASKANATKEDMLGTLKKEAEDTDHSSFDCFVAVFLSHGQQGAVYSADGETIQIQEIIDLFSGEKCKLQDKPKVFIFQTADIKTSDCGTGMNKSDSASDDLSELEKLGIQGEDYTDAAPFPIPLDIPPKSDIFVAMATTGKFHENMGSWFIQAFSYVLSQLAYKKHLVAMMKEVNHIVKINTTDRDLSDLNICVWKHSLTKNLFFYPGYKMSEDHEALCSLPAPNLGST